MRQQYKPPYIWLLLLFLILSAGVTFLVIVFIWDMIWDIYIGRIVYSYFLLILGLMCGAIWIKSTKSYTLEEFSDTFHSTRICDHVIFLAQQRKTEIEKIEKKRGL